MKQDFITGSDPEIWSVMVLYEDKPTRDQAMVLCDRLVRRFWSVVEFDFHWWRTDFLADTAMARTAELDAVDADIFVFSSSPATSLSHGFINWFRSLGLQRASQEGLFMDLTSALAQQTPLVQEKQSHLKELAGRAGLEYFNRIPPAYSETVLDPTHSVQARATQVTRLLDEMLKRIPPPSHYGLNE